MDFIYLIFIGLIALAIFAIPIIFLYALYLQLSKKGYRLIGLAVVIIPLLGLIYLIYTTVYPDDSFYFSEFKEVTLRDAPASATILRKDVFYPDFHGDYCSASLMRMPADDYSILLKDLANDKRITKNEQDNILLSSELSEVMGDFRTEQIIHGFTRKIAGQEDHFLFIGFLDDHKTIVVSICVS